MKTTERIGAALLALALGACATPTAKAPAKSHLGLADQAPASGDIPAPVQQSATLPKPKPAGRAETYSVVVNNVRVQDLLFALARDARLNVDVHPGINGAVTLNAIDQTLPQLLSRISKQVDMRWEIEGPNLMVMPDSPYLRNYKVDYVNMNRDTSGSVAVTTQIASTIPGAAGSTGTGSNNSITRIENTAKNRFWETLVQNLKDLLRETDKILPEGNSETVVEQAASQAGLTPPTAAAAAAATRNGATPQPQASNQQSAGTTVVRRTTFREAASVIANPETGVLSVRATARQHEKIQEFLDQVLANARRQVLIEATIVEVQLAQDYQQGIDWGRLRTDPSVSGIAGRAISPVTGSAQLVLGRAADGSADGAIRLLETFGKVKILSSPKISVLNNQTAVLKVTDNLVYFTVKVETNQNANNTTTNFTSTPYTVPVGFVMNVTPQISDNHMVLLNLRPSISRELGDGVLDPNPELRRLNIENRIPVIRTREMESVMRVEDGNIAVLGGLMEDFKNNDDSAVPFFHRIPILGALFTQRSDTTRKTELVIFLRPVIVREASVAGDYKGFRAQMPDDSFFNTGFTPPDYQLLPSTPGVLQ